MAEKRYGLVLLLFSLILVLSAVTSKADDTVKDYAKYTARHRQKRSIAAGLGGGGESCLQIYSVPKHNVLCDPSAQVQEELVTFKESLSNQVTALERLRTQVNSIDPTQPNELPPEVRERLDTIMTVRETQAGHQATFTRLDNEIRHLSERIGQIEAQDRQQVAKLIEQQTNLIKVTLHQSNMTLHETYVDRLTQSTQDLTAKLHQLENTLKTEIEETETKLEESVRRSETTGKGYLDETKTAFAGKISAFEQRLSVETQARNAYQIKTDGNADEVENLMQLLTTLREHQASYERDKEQLREVVTGLSTQLLQERTYKEQLMEQLRAINSTVSNSQAQQEQFKHQLNDCNNRSDALGGHLMHLQRRLEEKEHLLPRTLKVTDCRDALAFYYPTTGVYPVNPGQVGDTFDVYCDMEDGQGWTVFMRRQDGLLDFYRDWKAYRNGFGDLDAEHWLGLEKVYAMTSRKQYKLRVDLQDWNRKWWYAEYDRFSIENEDAGYKLHVSGYHGNAGDSMRFHNEMGFSTHDRNNDMNDGICARWCHGAWWYRDCFHSNLNGRYYTTGSYKTTTGWGDGVVWRDLKDTNFYSVRAAIMKITPVEDTGTEPSRA